MNKFCIIINTEKQEAVEAGVKIKKYLEEQSCVCVNATKDNDVDEDEGYSDVSKIPSDTECIIILGGDGTIIHVASNVAPIDIPILGINMGNMGYLADVEKDEIFDTLKLLIEDKYTINERLMMEGVVMHGDDVVFMDRVLNDIVVGRNGFSRLIGLNVYVNGELTETLRGDGVIVSTPTGSTGYNLSAGGPVIKPNSNVLVITPICTHSMGNKSIVVSSDDVITIEVIKSKKTQEQEVIASFDGSHGSKMGMGDVIEIRSSKYTTKMITTGNHGYFEVLRKKLK